MKILVAPDKFKGSLSAHEVCDAVEQGILNISPNTEVIKLPLADGGEGSLITLESVLEFERRYINVNNPLFNPFKTWYGVKGKSAFIELANASGLQLLNEHERDPENTTSYGTGELILDALKNGCNEIYLFIGGSSTNDAAIGIANALGYKFYDSNGIELKPIGKNLIKIDSLDNPSISSFKDVKFTILTDVQNTFYGKNGAAHVYAKQKGANEKAILKLDKGLRNIAEKFSAFLMKDVSNILGSGAAGGIGGGMAALFNADIKSGIEAIFQILNFDSQIKECDYLITGEGKFDWQTLEGKVVKGVIDKAKQYKKPIAVLCGTTTIDNDYIKELGITVRQIKSESISTEESFSNAYNLLVKRTEELIINLPK